MHWICRLKRNAHDKCYFQSVHVVIFGSAVICRVIFACTLQHSVSDRIRLFQSAPGPKLTSIINGFVPRIVQHNTELTHCLVKQLDRSRVNMFRSSPKINSRRTNIGQMRRELNPRILFLPQRSIEMSSQEDPPHE